MVGFTILRRGAPLDESADQEDDRQVRTWIADVHERRRTCVVNEHSKATERCRRQSGVRMLRRRRIPNTCEDGERAVLATGCPTWTKHSSPHHVSPSNDPTHVLRSSKPETHAHVRRWAVRRIRPWRLLSFRLDSQRLHNRGSTRPQGLRSLRASLRPGSIGRFVSFRKGDAFGFDWEDRSGSKGEEGRRGCDTTSSAAMRRARYVGSKVKDVGNAVLSASSFAMPALGGAVDVLAVRQPDGSMRCSPFYVRFGKYQGLLRSREKRVRLHVDGRKVDVTMQLGRSGEAYFVAAREAHGTPPTMDPTRGRNEPEEEEERMLDEWIRIQDEEIAMELDAYEAMEEMDGILSPTSGYSSGEEPPYATAAHAGPISQAEANAVLEATKQNNVNETFSAAVSPRAAAGQRALQQAGERQADGGALGTSTTCQPADWESTGERANVAGENGQLLEQVQLDLVVLEGICKVNLWVVPSEDMSMGTACSRKQHANRIAPKGALEETRKSKAAHRLFHEQDTIPEDSVASIADGGESVTSSPRDGAGRGSEDNENTQNHEVEGMGAIKTTGDEGDDKGAVEPVTPSKSDVVQVDWKDLAATGLELSMCGHLLESALEEDAMNSIFSEHIVLESAFKRDSGSILQSPNLVCRIQGQIVPFQMLLPAIIGGLAYNLPVSIPSDLRSNLPAASVGQALVLSKEQQKSEGWSKIFWPFNRSSSGREKQKTEAVEEIANSNKLGAEKVEDQQIVLKPRNLFQGNSHRYRRSLTPTSEQLASMGLQDGRNLITFTFKTSMWGIQQVQCYLYLINWDSKLVVTDVDGTITKSDMLGHLMPIVGKDWSHSGVANLFTNIKENGYVVVYLSSRSIGQASRTRDYLMNVIQDGEYLPYGPVLISPDGIFPSLYREVVLKRPHEFKINCLQNVKSLFPDDWSPFYAGFGNRPTDQLSYESVGIPRVRIFTINSKSEVVSAASTVKGAAWSSFSSINTFVDQMFPCMLGEKGLHEEFGDVNFWRVPVMELGEEDIEATENDQGARALVQKEGTPKVHLQSPDKRNLQPDKAPAAEGKHMDRASLHA